MISLGFSVELRQLFSAIMETFQVWRGNFDLIPMWNFTERKCKNSQDKFQESISSTHQVHNQRNGIDASHCNFITNSNRQGPQRFRIMIYCLLAGYPALSKKKKKVKTGNMLITPSVGISHHIFF